jgi:hypothetical protein
MLMVRLRRMQRGRGRLLRLIAALAILAVPAALCLQSAGAAAVSSQARLAASSAGDTTCSTASDRETTCTGTYGGGRAWDMENWNNQTGAEYPATRPPTVTVSPTTGLVSQVVHVAWSNFTPTVSLINFSSTGVPLPEPNADDGQGGSSNVGGHPLELYNLAIFECVGDDPQSAVGDGDQQLSKDCYDVADVTQVQATAGAANGVIGFTSANGTGQADVYVEAGSQNSFLHCGVTSPCSLVVVPNWGGQEAVPSAAGGTLPTACGTHTSDDGSAIDGEIPLAGYAYIGAKCSWADRIVVPLSFAPSPTNCPTTNTPAFQVDGSPMMESAIEQWQAGWCTGKNPLSFGYTSEDEYLARQGFLNGAGALSASVDMALTTQPANSTDSGGASPTARQYTYAPLANSAIAFAYYIDDPTTGEPLGNLTLNATLAAKLLTQSYALDYGCTGQKAPFTSSYDCDPAVAGNPASISDDPQFFGLNGGDSAKNKSQFPTDADFYETLYGPFLPTVLQGDSDMTYEMTGWMQADADAHAFLQGQREADGSTSMTVNKYYRDIGYPMSQFQPLDPGWSVQPSKAIGSNPLGADSSMQIAWNPVNELDNVAVDLATYDPTSDSPVPICTLGQGADCPGNNGWENPRLPGEFLGQDEMTAVVSESQAAADAFPTFQLVNAAGKAVGPTTSSMLAAVSQMKTNADGITQSANFSSKDPAAYPLTMVDYAMVPTCGLSSAKASAISAFLTDVATKGQTPGYLPGQLAPGYAPLNSHQLSQLKAAAQAVKAQHCVKHGGGGKNPGSNSTGGSTPGSTTSPSTTSPTKGTGTGKNPTTTSKVGKTPKTRNADYGVKDPFTAGLGRFIVPLLLVMGGILVLGGPVLYFLSITGAAPVLRKRIGALPHRVGGVLRGTLVRRS